MLHTIELDIIRSKPYSNTPRFVSNSTIYALNLNNYLMYLHKKGNINKLDYYCTMFVRSYQIIPEKETFNLYKYKKT